MSFFAILLAVNAIAQTNIIFVTGETSSNSVEVYIHNNSDEDITVHYFIASQDVIFPLIEGDTTVKRGEVFAINAEVDSAEYHSYICIVTSGEDFRSTNGFVERLVLPAKKER